MAISGSAIVWLAVGALAIGLLWGIIKAFDKSIGWGLIALLLVPAGTIVFLLVTVRDNYKPLLAVVAGFILLYISNTIAW